MAAIKCARCGAVITATVVEDGIHATYGIDFTDKCRARSSSDEAGIERCAEMTAALERAAFRLRRRAAVRAPEAPA